MQTDSNWNVGNQFIVINPIDMLKAYNIYLDSANIEFSQN